jgi:hypothetical protein
MIKSPNHESDKENGNKFPTISKTFILIIDSSIPQIPFLSSSPVLPQDTSMQIDLTEIINSSHFN